MRWPWKGSDRAVAAPPEPARAESAVPAASAVEPARAAEPDLWRVVAASICGAAHVRTNDSCQDAHAWRTTPGDILIAAVADGAGSASHGGAGAQLAAAHVVEHLVACVAGGLPATTSDWDGLLRGGLEAARTALLEEAVVRDLPPRELATTLIVLVTSPAGMAVGQIGDGAAVLREVSGELTALTRPLSSEYVNHTTFLTSDDALATAQVVARIGPATSVALLTDGLQRLALRMPEGEPHAPFFAPLFQFLDTAADLEAAHRELETFLGSPRIQERADDDLTLFLAARRGLSAIG